jgi:hypothetical protein
VGAADIVAAWEAEDVAAGFTTSAPLPDPDERGMAFALACCGPVSPAKVRRLLVDGDGDALSPTEADQLHEWIGALLFATGEPEDDEQLAMWLDALEVMP